MHSPVHLHFLCICIFFALAFSLHLHFYFAHPPIPPLPLRYNTTLRSLNLEWNPVGEAGATILLNSMRLGNTSLTELNVGSCGISLATQRLQRNPCLFPDCPLLIRVFRPECCCRKSQTIAPTWLPRAKRRGSQARLNPSHLYRLSNHLGRCTAIRPSKPISIQHFLLPNSVTCHTLAAARSPHPQNRNHRPRRRSRPAHARRPPQLGRPFPARLPGRPLAR